MSYNRTSGYFEFSEPNLGNLQYPYLIIQMIPNTDNTILTGYYKNGAKSGINLTKIDQIPNIPAANINGVWKVYIRGTPDGYIRINFDRTDILQDKNIGTVQQEQSGINLGYTKIKYGGYNGNKFAFGNESNIENSIDIFRLNNDQLIREDENSIRITFVKQPITPAPTTPAPTTPIPTTPIPTFSFSSSFEGTWKLNIPGDRANVTISSSGINTFNVSGTMASGMDLPYTYRLLSVNPTTLLCSFPRFNSNDYSYIEPIIINGKVVDISNNSISFTREVSPPSLTSSDPIEGTWPTYNFFSYPYGPVNITLVKPKQYYISPVNNINIQYDGRLLSINDNGSLICTRRGDNLTETVKNGKVIRILSSNIYLNRPAPIS